MAKQKFNKSMESSICELYTQNHTMSSISAKFLISTATVYNVLKRNNVKTRPHSCNRKYNLDESYFEKVDSEEKAYFLGFLFADGHICKDGYSFSIHIHEQDVEILEKFKKMLQYGGPIRKIPGYNYGKYNCGDSVVLHITSKKIINDLNCLGIVNNKTTKPRIPQIPKYLFRHFLRGVNDGDGNIFTKQKANKRITSSITILLHELIFDYITSSISEDLNCFTFSQKTHPLTNYIKIFNINGNKKVYQFLNYIYNNNQSKMHLTRKHAKYLEILQYFNIFYFNKVKYRGVFLDKRNKKFIAYISHNGQKLHLGVFKTANLAAEAYNKKAIEILGNAAILNQISSP